MNWKVLQSHELFLKFCIQLIEIECHSLDKPWTYWGTFLFTVTENGITFRFKIQNTRLTKWNWICFTFCACVLLENTLTTDNPLHLLQWPHLGFIIDVQSKFVSKWLIIYENCLAIRGNYENHESHISDRKKLSLQN